MVQPGGGRLLITGSQADIRVDKFVLGNLNSQFISGSNSKIEISSSKIHVKPNGDIVVGKISATEGSIGGFIIGTGSIVNDAGSGAGKGLLLDAEEKELHLMTPHLEIQDYSLNLITLIQECLLVDLKLKEVHHLLDLKIVN